MMAKRKTICVGRYLVDVPEHAAVTLGGALLNGFEIQTIEEGDAEFRARVATREAEIASHDPSDGYSGMVRASDLRIERMVGRVFTYGRHRDYWIEKEKRVDTEWVSIEAYAYLNGHSFILSQKIAQESEVADIEALLLRLRLRGVHEVPSAAGFCIQGAFFADPLPDGRNEQVMMSMALPTHPDLTMGLASLSGIRPGPGLLERVAKMDQSKDPATMLLFTKLRSGKRNINGIIGDEVLTRVRELNFTTGYGLNWETRGVATDLLQPFLSLEMQTGVNERAGGKPVETSLHEDALLALWDDIASSIRLRQPDSPPGGPAPAPPAPEVKLGTVARAGDVCMQSGWGRCDVGGRDLAVQGGQVQYLRQGERMPQPLLLPRRTLWEKVRRRQPSMEHKEPVAWKLIDKRLRPRSAAIVALASAHAPASGSEDSVVDERSVRVGTGARTGEACPASGWWRCDEPEALDGTRWFASGSLLPAATLPVPTGVFSRSGGPAFIQRRGAWSLVKHAASSSMANATAAGDADDALPSTSA